MGNYEHTEKRAKVLRVGMAGKEVDDNRAVKQLTFHGNRKRLYRNGETGGKERSKGPS